MSIVIWILLSLVLFLLVVIRAMAFGHRQELARRDADYKWAWSWFNECLAKRDAVIRDERGLVEHLIGQVDPACTGYHALERENARLERVIAEQSVLLAAAGIDGAYGACQLELPQPPPFGGAQDGQMELPHYDVVLSEELAAPSAGSGQAADAERGTLTWDSKAADGLDNDWVEDLS